MGLWIALGYYAGAMIMLRQFVLWLDGKREARNEIRRRRRARWYREDEVYLAIPVVIAWPVVVLAIASWKLMFPHGVKTRAARQREREARQQAAEKEAARQLAHDEELYRQAAAILREYVVEQDAIEAAVPTALRTWNPDPTDDKVLVRSVAEACFAEACEQVWRERGKPWHIGALEAVRVSAVAGRKR